jgi:hypothetical protein
VSFLSDLAGRDAWEMMHEINVQAGRPIWRPPLAAAALENLIDAGEREARFSARPARGRG